MKKEIPILFSTPMVQAILEGRKTITRRTKSLEFVNDNLDWNWEYKGLCDHGHLIRNNLYGSQNAVKCPYGKPGDILWVRESITVLEPEHCIAIKERFAYKADVTDAESEKIRQEFIKMGYPYQWKPSIHMPKDACRIWLEVTEVRAERLQEINEQEVKAEGIEETDGPWFKVPGSNTYKPTAKAAFVALWKSINGEESWNANPWLWVISFSVISTTGKPCI